ncbi:MAG: hypothetical protein HY059_02430 [Proteobacteria bacterium]|nr:hypothetical protein [Pseudomonadota bacterium]
MLSSDELMAISSHNELGFIELVDLVARRADELIRNQDFSQHTAESALNHIFAFSDDLGIPLRGVTRSNKGNDYYDWFNKNMAALQYTKSRLIFGRNASVGPIVSGLSLTDVQRSKIRHHLGVIKGIVDEMDISEAQRRKIFDTLAAVEAEVIKRWTRMDSFVALVLLVASISVAGAAISDSVSKIDAGIKNVISIVSEAVDERQLRLNAPDRPVGLLPAPDQSDDSTTSETIGVIDPRDSSGPAQGGRKPNRDDIPF